MSRPLQTVYNESSPTDCIFISLCGLVIFMSCPVRPAGDYVSGLSVRPSLCPSYVVCVCDFYVQPGMTSGMFMGCLSVLPSILPSVCSSVTLLGTILSFQQIIMHVWQCRHDVKFLLTLTLTSILTCSQGHV